MGGTFNRLVRAVTGIPFKDTQCGFKAFDGEAARLLFELSSTDGFAFDVEVIARAVAMRLDLVEVPVRWREVEGTHVRPLADPARMAVDVVLARRRRSGSAPVIVTDDDPSPEVLSAVSAVTGRGRFVVRSGGRLLVPLPSCSSDEVARVGARVSEASGGASSRATSMNAVELAGAFALREQLLRGRDTVGRTADRSSSCLDADATTRSIRLDEPRGRRPPARR
jgi:hypothetical protein